VSLKLAALDRTLLAQGRRVTLVGTGASLERWRAALGDRVAGVREARVPDERTLDGDGAPYVLIYVSPLARRRWREQAARKRLQEMSDFIFAS
jgi:hypothetical protein